MPASMLAHLSTKFSAQDEVVTTEALAFVLRASQNAREGLAGLLGAVAQGAVPVARVSTQQMPSKESKPDFTVFDDEGRTLAFIEAKFWAPFTQAQPVAYLHRLSERGGSTLLVIVPTGRLEASWADLMRRC